MQIYHFSKETGKHIRLYESNFFMSRILLAETSLQVSCMYLETDGMVGYHHAAIPQLMLIMNGEATVKGKEDVSRKVKRGEAVFWQTGEGHETVTDKGMTAVIMEGKGLNPERFMQEMK